MWDIRLDHTVGSADDSFEVAVAAAPAMTYHVVDGAKVDSMGEDIWSGCVCRGIAASRRAGWPNGPCRAAEVPMSKPFRASSDKPPPYM